jgi:hypothetical protein
MALERVLVLSGLRGAAPSPFADEIAALRARLADLVALVKARLAAAKDAANRTAKATKAGDVNAALRAAHQNATASVLAHNADAQAQLLRAGIEALEQGKTEAAGVLIQAFDAIAAHSYDRVPKLLGTPDAFGSFQRRGLSGLGQVIERTAGDAPGGTVVTGYIADSVDGRVVTLSLTGQKSIVGTLGGAELAAYNQALSDCAYTTYGGGTGGQAGASVSAPNTNTAQCQQIRAGTMPYREAQQANGTPVAVYYNASTRTLRVEAAGQDFAPFVADNLAALAKAAAGAVGEVCGLLNSGPVQAAAGAVTGVNGVGSSACKPGSSTPPPNPMASATPGWVWPAVIIGGGFAAFKLLAAKGAAL